MNAPATIAVACVLSALVLLLASTPRIQAWERANGYPYGRMCQSIFTAYVDTCPTDVK